MGAIMSGLGKIFCLSLSAALGVAAGLAVFGSLMLIKVEGSAMLPTLEPGDRVLVQKAEGLSRKLNLEIGDLVIYEAPYYTADGEGLLKIRRITGQRGSWIRLDSDLQTVDESEVLVRRSEILGEVLVKFP